MVKLLPSKQVTWVRFPSAAPNLFLVVNTEGFKSPKVNHRTPNPGRHTRECSPYASPLAVVRLMNHRLFQFGSLRTSRRKIRIRQRAGVIPLFEKKVSRDFIPCHPFSFHSFPLLRHPSALVGVTSVKAKLTQRRN